MECNWIAWCKQFYSVKKPEEKKVVEEGDGRSNSINGARKGGSFKAWINKSRNQVSTHQMLFLKDKTINFIYIYIYIYYFIFFAFMIWSQYSKSFRWYWWSLFFCIFHSLEIKSFKFLLDFAFMLQKQNIFFGMYKQM